MDVLDLGCGWGSLALFIAERYPHCRVTAMSNSRTQAEHIAAACAAAGSDAVTPVTADIATFDARSALRPHPLRGDVRARARLPRALRPAAPLAGSRTAASSSTSSVTRASPTRSTPRTRTTGWARASSAAARCRRTTSSCSSTRTSSPRSAGGCPATHYARTLEDWLRRYDARAAAIRPILARDVRRRDGARLVGGLAAVLPRLRRDVRVRGRPGMGGLTLPAGAAVTGAAIGRGKARR